MTLTQSDYDLDYLFVAETFNGQVIKQTPDDRPRYSSWGTMVTDLLQEQVKRFSLVGKGHMFTIDLVDGHFEMDGNKLYAPHEIPPNMPLRFIYYRQVTRDILVGTDGKPVAPKVKYFIGWQYTHEGKNKKWEIGVE